MPGCYRHLQYEERCQIQILRRQGLSVSEIARQLRRDKSTVSRDVRRNSGQAGYRCKPTQRRTTERRSAASSAPRKLTAAVWVVSSCAVESRRGALALARKQ